jgi:hypothetical protein
MRLKCKVIVGVLFTGISFNCIAAAAATECNSPCDGQTEQNCNDVKTNSDGKSFDCSWHEGKCTTPPEDCTGIIYNGD